MPLTQSQKFKLQHDKVKRDISNDFSVAWRRIALGEGLSAAVIAWFEASVAVILALLLLPTPGISQAAAVLVAAGAGWLVTDYGDTVTLSTWYRRAERHSSLDTRHLQSLWPRPRPLPDAAYGFWR